MNQSERQDSLGGALSKQLLAFSLGLAITCINGAFVYTFYSSPQLRQEARYVLYIHLVINDMILLSLSVVLLVISYSVRLDFTSCCVLLLLTMTTNKNSPLNLAGMAAERYVAVCLPLQHVRLCTVRRAGVLMALVWLVSFLSTAASFSFLAQRPARDLSGDVLCHQHFVFNMPAYTVFNTVFQVLLFSFVSLAITATYVRIFVVARGASGSDREAARSASHTVALHAVQLLLCMSSFLSPLVNRWLVGWRPRSRTTLLFGSYLLTNVLPRLLSPLIYGLRDRKFSGRVRAQLCVYCACCGARGALQGGRKAGVKTPGGHRR